MSKRELYFKNYKTGEVGQRANVTGLSERQVEKCLRGMLINKHDDWLVFDTADEVAIASAKGKGDRP